MTTPALMNFLSNVAGDRGQHCYIVGGAVRNHLMGHAIKDIDVVVDSVALNGWSSADFATAVARAIPAATNLTTNKYGVAILTISGSWNLDGTEMRGEVIEIANARKESYGGAEGKGYKPHMVEPATIQEDLVRREFTFNTLLWRLSDLQNGPEKAEVLDLLGTGLNDLQNRTMRCPTDPDRTFSDDPTRMLRAIKFHARYQFRFDASVWDSIKANAHKMKQMPWDAVRKIFVEDILMLPNGGIVIHIMQTIGLLPVLCEMVNAEPGMAKALGRASVDLPVWTTFTLMDYGFRFQSPLNFLTKEERSNVIQYLAAKNDFSLARDKELEALFVEALIRPPINQQALFTTYNIPLKERGEVVRMARQAMLANLSLAQEPEALHMVVEQAVSAHYPRV